MSASFIAEVRLNGVQNIQRTQQGWLAIAVVSRAGKSLCESMAARHTGRWRQITAGDSDGDTGCSTYIGFLVMEATA